MATIDIPISQQQLGEAQSLHSELSLYGCIHVDDLDKLYNLISSCICGNRRETDLFEWEIVFKGEVHSQSSGVGAEIVKRKDNVTLHCITPVEFSPSPFPGGQPVVSSQWTTLKYVSAGRAIGGALAVAADVAGKRTHLRRVRFSRLKSKIFRSMSQQSSTWISNSVTFFTAMQCNFDYEFCRKGRIYFDDTRDIRIMIYQLFKMPDFADVHKLEPLNSDHFIVELTTVVSPQENLEQREKRMVDLAEQLRFLVALSKETTLVEYSASVDEEQKLQMKR